MTTTKPSEQVAWYTLSAQDAASRLGVDPDRGLGGEQAARLLAEYGPNELPTEPPPSVWVVARGQLANPMNIMLLVILVLSIGLDYWWKRSRTGKAGAVQVVPDPLEQG